MSLRDSVIRLLIAVLFAVNIYIAATEPCTSAEAAVYRRYASRPILTYWSQPFDPRLGLVYGVLARLATRIAGVSELTIRFPAIVGGLLLWFALAKFLPGWRGLLAFAAICANPWTYRAFSTVSGGALAAGLFAAAIYQSKKSLTATGLLTSLAIGTDGAIAVLAIPIAIIAAAVQRGGFWRWIDDLIIPAVVGALLVFPILLTREKALPAASDDFGTRQLIRTLMQRPQVGHSTLVGVSRSIEPGVVFYRRRYHLDWMTIEVPSARDSYHLLTSEDERIVSTLHLHVLQKKGSVVLAVP